MTIIDSLSGEPIDFESDKEPIDIEIPVIIDGGEVIGEPRPKAYVAGVSVTLLSGRVQHWDANGTLVTESSALPRHYPKRTTQSGP